MVFKGIVQKGGEYGRRLGFPTANIPLTDSDVSGIFAAKVRVEGKEFVAAVYADQRNNVLEAHLLDFEGDLYGKELEIELRDRIREDRQFETEEEAKTAIADDVRKVLAWSRMP